MYNITTTNCTCCFFLSLSLSLFGPEQTEGVKKKERKKERGEPYGPYAAAAAAAAAAALLFSSPLFSIPSSSSTQLLHCIMNHRYVCECVWVWVEQAEHWRKHEFLREATTTTTQHNTTHCEREADAKQKKKRTPFFTHFLPREQHMEKIGGDMRARATDMEKETHQKHVRLSVCVSVWKGVRWIREEEMDNKKHTRQRYYKSLRWE